MNLKKLERYLRVNMLGPGPRLMKKEFTGPRSPKCWETLVQITIFWNAVIIVGNLSDWHLRVIDGQKVAGRSCLACCLRVSVGQFATEIVNVPSYLVPLPTWLFTRKSNIAYSLWPTTRCVIHTHTHTCILTRICAMASSDGVLLRGQ